MSTLSIIIASNGRPTLAATLASVSTQVQPGDEILVDVNKDSPWGHRARNRRMPQTFGDGLMFIDDDDVYLPGALQLARLALDRHPDRMHMFKMRYENGVELWIDEEIRLGNVSTQMFVVPNLWRWNSSAWRAPNPDLPKWGDVYEGDFHFISGCAERMDVEWHLQVISLYRQQEWRI